MKEAGSTDENKDRMVTTQDIKTAARTSCLKKWQRRWDLTNSGRDLYSCRKHVGVKGSKNIQLKFSRIISKLKTGYLCKIGVIDKPYCKCGEIETVDHYIMECEEFQDLRKGHKSEIVPENWTWSVVNESVSGSYRQGRILPRENHH